MVKGLCWVSDTFRGVYSSGKGVIWQYCFYAILTMNKMNSRCIEDASARLRGKNLLATDSSTVY